MNRIIQYRVRNKHTGELIGYERVNSSGHWEQQRLNRQEWLLGVITDGQIALELLREQYIGHTDKKGIDIYENDICDGHSDGYGVIKWAEFDGGYNYEFADTNVVGVRGVMKDLIIVGNIHDNPDLLK